MRISKLFIIFLMIPMFLLSCKMSKKEMTLEDFLKIDIEITTTDMTEESIEKVAKKYGYTLEQYKELSEKVKNDPKLQEKLGEIRLGEHKKNTEMK